MNIGRVIKDLRKEKGFNQIEFAAKCSITQTSLSLIETDSQRPNPSTLKKICKVLDIHEMFLYILSVDEKDIPENKKEKFEILFPTIENMIKQLWADDKRQKSK